MDMDMARARPSNGRATCIGGGLWCSAFEPICRLPAAPPSPLGPSRTPTGPLMQGIAVESRKYEVGQEQDAKGDVQVLHGACRRGRLRPVGTQTTQRVSVVERENVRAARAVETHRARLLGEVIDELQPPGW